MQIEQIPKDNQPNTRHQSHVSWMVPGVARLESVCVSDAVRGERMQVFLSTSSIVVLSLYLN